ncbi:hypothetical protein PBAT_01740 [Paenibacillus antarcticus]|uniref:Short-chain dehydrogenase n=1 Tax=Paenibacillus antarcticus TaxID=253703 RepID=A0A168QZ65_9BACL|nr:hypothetical protein PBAT_01740 [Paenibacillus antarcticus]
MIHLANAMGADLSDSNVSALALSPGFLRSEAMLEYFGVMEENWQEGARKDPHFIASETPCYIGRAVASLAADPEIMRKSGKAFSTWGLVEEYGYQDKDGTQPHWGDYYAEVLSKEG